VTVYKFAGYCLHWDVPGDVYEDTGTRFLVPRGALDIADDIPLLFGHDPSREYARVSAGTLQLWEDPIGVGCEFEITDYHLANTISRGGTTGLSFGYLRDDTYVEERECGKVEIFNHGGVEELSVVTFPKMPGAHCWVRDWDQIEDIPPECRRLALSWEENILARKRSSTPPARGRNGISPAPAAHSSRGAGGVGVLSPHDRIARLEGYVASGRISRAALDRYIATRYHIGVGAR
jgi:HK97 family phage prohead protease